MAFKSIKKLFKGELIQVCPCKGYGYISPEWNREALSSKNLYCYYASDSEKQRKQCFLKIFEKGGKFSDHEVIYNFKGEEIWLPVKPQTIYFEVEIEGLNIRCIHLFDERHLSLEEKAEAEANSAKEPNFESLLKEQEALVAALMEEASVRDSSTEPPATAEEHTEEASVVETPVAAEKTPVTGAVFVSAPVETTVEGEFDYGDEPSSDFDEGFKAGEEDGKAGIYRPQEYLFEGEDSLPSDFEEGYEAGYKVGDAERLDALYGESEEKTKKKIKNKAKEEGIPLESLNQREEDKKSSQNKKAQKKAEEAAFEAAFSESDC